MPPENLPGPARAPGRSRQAPSGRAGSPDHVPGGATGVGATRAFDRASRTTNPMIHAIQDVPLALPTPQLALPPGHPTTSDSSHWCGVAPYRSTLTRRHKDPDPERQRSRKDRGPRPRPSPVGDRPSVVSAAVFLRARDWNRPSLTELAGHPAQADRARMGVRHESGSIGRRSYVRSVKIP